MYSSLIIAKAVSSLCKKRPHVSESPPDWLTVWAGCTLLDKHQDYFPERVSGEIENQAKHKYSTPRSPSGLLEMCFRGRGGAGSFLLGHHQGLCTAGAEHVFVE